MSAVLEAPAPDAPAVVAPPVDLSAPPPAAAPISDPKPWSSEVLTPDGKFIDAWQDKLPDDFADDRALLGRFGDLKTLVKSLKDNMATARAKTDGLVKIPGTDAPAEERAAYLKAIGVPDDPAGYGIKAPEKLPDGVTWNDELSGEFGKVAHEIGLTPAQVARLQDFQLGSVGKQAESSRAAAQQALDAEKAELTKSFGANLPKAIDHAQRLAKQEGLRPEIFDPQSPDFWGVDALAFASRVASRLGEDKLIPGAAVRNLGGAALAADIVRNADNPDHAKYHAGDPTVTSKVRDLYKLG